MKFTDRKIRNLKPKRARYEVWEGKGLGLRVSPTGRKSWVFMYRYDGKCRRLTLGTYPAMSVAAVHATHGRALLDLERGVDPGTAAIRVKREDRQALTVAQLVEEYIDKWAKARKRSWHEDQRILAKDVLPVLGTHKAKDVRRRDIIQLLDRIVDRGAPIVANRTLEVVRKMFNFAVGRDILEANPCVMIHAPGQENRKDRVLTEDELRQFWHGLDQASMSAGVRLALRLLLLTAQRRGEIAGIEWGEIDLFMRWWTIPAERSKNGLAHRVPLSTQAVRVLQQAQNLANDSRYVFPSGTRDEPVRPRSLTQAIARNRAVFGCNHFTPHDLRRTAASYMTSMRIPRLVVAKILNHAEHSVTAIYDRHSYDAEKRQALDEWGRKLEAIVTLQRNKVVAIA